LCSFQKPAQSKQFPHTRNIAQSVHPDASNADIWPTRNYARITQEYARITQDKSGAIYSQRFLQEVGNSLSQSNGPLIKLVNVINIEAARKQCDQIGRNDSNWEKIKRANVPSSLKQPLNFDTFLKS
jgi:hypothetical protein